MSAPAPTSAVAVPDLAPHPHRWRILAVVALAVFVTVMDGTIVNVALPSLTTELGATNRQLQWIVDAYLVVFTGLLLAAGGLADRFGRRRTLIIGLVLFAATSALAGSAGSSTSLIISRALMGVGAALIFPATLAIIANVFTNPKERAAAIGIWSAVSGIAVAAGPIAGGWLLENFWWGSVFFINVPIAAIAIAGAAAIVPESTNDDKPRLDTGGLALSIAAIVSLVFTIIEAPAWGWADPRIIAGFIVAAALTVAFVGFERRQPHPLLPVKIFENLRFTAASISVTAASFALFGFIFLITQYFQLIRGYGPLSAGLRTLPVAFSIAASSVLAPKIVVKFGTKRVVAAGLMSMTVAFVWISTASAATAYLEIVGQMIFLGAGLGLTTAPATESIMGSVSTDQAGIGSAVNDTTRQLGGTLGVAVIGSVFSSTYISRLRDSAVIDRLPPTTQRATEESVGAAGAIAEGLGNDAAAYIDAVQQSFLDGLSAGCLVAATITMLGVVVALRFLPARSGAPVA
jgi:EmrB/QacA subfamily drug resistance transporter